MTSSIGSIHTTCDTLSNKYYLSVTIEKIGSIWVDRNKYYVSKVEGKKIAIGENLSLDSSGDNIIFPQKIISKIIDKSFTFVFCVNDVKLKNKVFKINSKIISKARKEIDFRKEDGLVYFPKTYIVEIDVKADSVVSKNESKFSHLHLHTTYSELDGMGTADEFIERAKTYGHRAISVTDHGNMGGIPSLFESAKENNIKPIAGIEAYFVQDHTNRSKENRYNYAHINLLAKNKVGFRNLMKLTSASYKYGFYYRPRIDFKILEYFKEGIICCSACLRGPMARLLYYQDDVKIKTWLKYYEEACSVAKKLYKIFGEDFYFEFMFNDIEQQGFVNTIQYNILNNMNKGGANVGAIISNDVHYLCVGDNDIHNRIVNISAPTLRLESSDFYYRTYSQISRCAKKIQTKTIGSEKFKKVLQKFQPFSKEVLKLGLNGVHEIWHDKCEEYDIFDPHHHLPKYSYKSDPVFKKHSKKEGIKSNEDFLRFIVTRNLTLYLKKYPELDKKVYKERLKKELDIICPAFVDYMLIVYDIIRFARSVDIMCGPGRGSVPGSLVSMMLKITTIDPIKHNLLFERFLNTTRLSEERQALADSLPDIDLDFQASRRDEIKDYLVEKYGVENVANIGTVSKLSIKSALKDMFRVESDYLKQVIEELKAKIDKDEQTREDEKLLEKLENMYGQIAHWKVTPVIKNLDSDIDVPSEARYESEQLDEMIDMLEEHYKDKTDIEFSWTQKYVDRLIGLTRGSGVHAAGIVVAPKRIKGSKEPTVLTDFVPVRIDTKSKSEQIIATQWEDDYIDKVGLLKLDLLGLKQLDIFDDCMKMVLKRRGKFPYDIYNIPLDDKQVFKTLGRGETSGVFQMNTYGPTEFLKKLRPTEFEDLIATISLLRPGPMAAGAHFDYIKLKHGHEKPVYDHKVLKPVLRNTYGLIIYQEQVMQGLVVAGGLTLSESDQFRTIMKKKKKTEEYFEFEKKFIKFATTKLRMSKTKAKELWEKFGAFSGYGFNRSHATVYAYIGYCSQFLKIKYPEEWWAACLNRAGDEDKIAQSFDEARAHGIKFSLPNVQVSGHTFKIFGKNNKTKIALPLSMIKGIGEKAALAIEEHQPFKNVDDFKERVPGRNANKKVKTLLAGFGAFPKNRFGNRKELFQELLKVEKSRGRGENKIVEVTLGEMPEDFRGLTITERKRLQNEMMSINYHDFSKDFFREYPEKRKRLVSIEQFSKLDDYESAAVVGNIIYVRERDSKQGKMCVVGLKQNNITLEITMFAAFYNYFKSLKNDLGISFKDYLRTGNFVYAEGPKGTWSNRLQMKFGNEDDGEVIPLM